MDITELQTKLTALGFSPGPIDDQLGPQTLAAIKRFQKSRGLTVDGIVGPITEAALANALGPATPPPARSPDLTAPLQPKVINRKKFLDAIKSEFGGKFDLGQVDGITKILDEWEKRELTHLPYLAYMLATTKLETANTMQPVREMGGEDYLKSKKYYPWVGEGLVQVTWEANARKFGATEPGQLLTWPICLGPLFDGMLKGMFTGKKLSDYLDSTPPDFLHCRRVINGMDKAAEIAGSAEGIFAGLKSSLT